MDLFVLGKRKNAVHHRLDLWQRGKIHMGEWEAQIWYDLHIMVSPSCKSIPQVKPASALHLAQQMLVGLAQQEKKINVLHKNHLEAIMEANFKGTA